MRILVTGSRKVHVEPVQLEELLLVWGPYTHVIHGGAQGIDMWAHHYANKHKMGYSVRRAQWDMYPKIAGFIRNQAMVNEGANLCVACPGPTSHGTYDCVERARRAGIPVHWIKLPGLTEEYHVEQQAYYKEHLLDVTQWIE